MWLAALFFLMKDLCNAVDTQIATLANFTCTPKSYFLKDDTRINIRNRYK